MEGGEGIEARGKGLHVFISARRRHHEAGMAVSRVHLRLVSLLVMGLTRGINKGGTEPRTCLGELRQ